MSVFNKRREFVRFILVGILATATHYGIYFFLCVLMLPAIAYTIGYVISFILNFYLSNIFTFNTTNGKTNCSIFKKHFVPGLPLLTQNKMCILLQKNRGNLFSCLYFRSEPSKKINGWVKCWILPIL